MSNALFYLAIVAIIATAAVLFAGLRNFFKGGSGNFSNKMMQLRILMQLIALIIIVAALLLAGR